MHLPACKISPLAVAASLALWMQTGFVEREQQMNWSLASGNLEPLRTSFDVRSTSGAVTARLGHEPVLSNGRDLIALNVSFNNQPPMLTNTVVVHCFLQTVAFHQGHQRPVCR